MEFDRKSLLDAFLQQKRFKDKHPDLRDYYNTKNSAFQKAFGIDLNSFPKQGVESVWPDWQSPVLATTRLDLVTNQTSLEINDDNRFFDDPSNRAWGFSLFNILVREYLKTHSPFADYIEMPSLVALFQQHSNSEQLVEQLKAEQFRMMNNLLGIVWGLSAHKKVSAQTLLQHNFDPKKPQPDLWDYL